MQKYKSKMIVRGETFYNIHHFNWFIKLIARIFYRIKIEDIEDREK